jgi:5-methylthioadenosine/S-adenosylhomocysteine deaminase
MPLTDPHSLIAYSMYPEDVDTVIVDGHIIMENRKILTIDEKFVKEKFKESYKRISKYSKT